MSTTALGAFLTARRARLTRAMSVWSPPGSDGSPGYATSRRRCWPPWPGPSTWSRTPTTISSGWPGSPRRAADRRPLPGRAEPAGPARRLAGHPAFVLDRRLDLLAGNALADALSADFTEADNLVRMTFLDPAGSTFFADRRRATEACVANLRLALGHDSQDRRARDLVEEVGAASAEFRRLWRRHDVQGKTHGAKTLRHGAVGELTLSYHAFEVREAPGQQLIVYRAQPDSRSAEALRLLGTLAASGWLR
ncbi:transcriptional regulator [Micromonospora sp. NPDC047134]|uniref:MmyB family transcriptional regulator n=1 Tax=Micromonospora sp. NPDC047134 TaxID=3154340 RepID=UPI0033D2B1BF